VIDGHEHTDLAFLGGDGGGQIRPPELVRAVGDDGPVMSLRAVGMADPLRGLEAVLPHQPADALLRGPEALEAEPGPDLAVTLAMERRLGEDAADVAQEFLVRAGTERAALLGSRPFFEGDRPSGPLEVQRRAGQVPDATDAGQAVALSGGGGDGLADRLGLLGTKGRSARQRWSSSSLSLVSSPTLARRRAISSSRSSAGRLLRAAWPPARKSSRQPTSVDAVTPSSRERSSRLSPPRRRRTAAVLRWEEKRPRSPGFGVVDMGVDS
jgi:hypothetical protein